jgi:hypothetical protein
MTKIRRLNEKAIILIQNYFLMTLQIHLGSAITKYFATSPLLTETFGLIKIFQTYYIVNYFGVSSHAYINWYGMYT